ncbi:MAG: sulfotransferase [Pikeienuella sp.]|uniref:sulfotransferase n=1 Tax=Pikeienuella sp. TaxID=2831957 RepID=UPI00391BC936
MLIGVGAQKAGTSWLFRHLAGDPDVYASPIKELHFFDAWLGPRRLAVFDRRYREKAAQMRRPLPRLAAPRMSRAVIERAEMSEDRAAYLSYFASRVHRERFLLEVTPGYSLLNERGWSQARRFLEEAGLAVRPVFLMRDPVDRHFSALRMEQRKGRIADAGAAFRSSLGWRAHRAHGRYDRALTELWSAFGKDHVAVGFYEHIFATPERHLRALTDSLGLPWREPDMTQRVNASAAPSTLSAADRAAGVEAFRKVYDFVNARFGAEKPASWSA